MTGVDQNTTKRAIRFQIELRAGDPVITTGLTVRVDDGGKNKQLEQFAYTVQSSVNSSHAALRTIEAISEGLGIGFWHVLDDNDAGAHSRQLPENEFNCLGAASGSTNGNHSGSRTHRQGEFSVRQQ